jgi:hypothetical protein
MVPDFGKQILEGEDIAIADLQRRCGLLSPVDSETRRWTAIGRCLA